MSLAPKKPDGQSLFGPASVSWRVNREAAVLLGGGRALVLQVTHPLVAAGVAAHSRFRQEPLARLWRTLDLMLTIVFAPVEDARSAVRQIERVHARVRGTLAAPAGRFPAGTPYDASDPELLLWVHATLVDSAVCAYERFVAPLTAAERAAYYDESTVAARLFGIPERLIPATAADFDAYLRTQLEALVPGDIGREITAAVLRPPVPLALTPLFRLVRFVTVGLLPPLVRTRFGFAWSPRDEARLGRLAGAVRRLLPHLPRHARLLPHARRAGAFKTRSR